MSLVRALKSATHPRSSRRVVVAKRAPTHPLNSECRLEEKGLPFVKKSNSGRERRENTRVVVHLDTHWKREQEVHEGILRDLGKSGCFVMTDEQVMVGERLSVEVGLPGAFHMMLRGIVTRTIDGLGFGLRFKDLKVTERALIERLVEQHRKKTT